MTSGFISDWVYCDKSIVPPNVIRNLTLQVTEQNGITTDYPIFGDEGSHYALPRFCEFSKRNIFLDYRTPGETININLKPEFSPKNKYQENAISSILRNENGIVQAKTAFGKTYVAIDSICRLKVKALILVHKDGLVTQWKSEFLKYTDLQEDEIEILSGSEYSINPRTKIFIATVQNLASKTKLNKMEYREKLYGANIGVTFLDECHVTGAPYVFMQSTRWCSSKRIYGLSATPSRGDTFDKVLNWILGDVIFRDTCVQMPVYYTFAPFNLTIPPKQREYMTWGRNSYSLRYMKWLTAQQQYIDHACEILKILAAKNRKPLVISSYKEILTAVYDNLELPDSDRKISVHGTTFKYVQEYKKNGEPKKNMKKVKVDHTFLDGDKHDVVFSTLGFFDAGISIDWLDTLVFLTPPPIKSETALTQLVGRILRDHPGKNYVLLVDLYNDNEDIERYRMLKRIGRFKQLNFLELPNTITEKDLLRNIAELDLTYSGKN